MSKLSKHSLHFEHDTNQIEVHPELENGGKSSKEKIEPGELGSTHLVGRLPMHLQESYEVQYS